MSADHHELSVTGSMPRRTLLQLTAGAAGLMTVGASAQTPAAETVQIKAEEHWVMKGPVKLYLYRKRIVPAANERRPVLFLVHGSTISSRGTYDLILPGNTDYSAMEHFARLGYDVWTMDHEGYGHSSRTSDNSGIQTGVADLKAALPYVGSVTGQSSVAMFGESSGAIRAGAFAMVEPNRVSRLILHAFTYTGEKAPEMDRRRKNVEAYKANPRRPFGLAQVRNMFDRDVAGKSDPALIQALAESELKFGDSVPSGTYLDMAINMPMVDPAKLRCPVCLVRPEHDGNATEEELYTFFRALGGSDKQFVLLHGMTHGGAMVGAHRKRLWHVMHTFFQGPPAPAA